MRLRVRIGEVLVVVDGLDLTRRQLLNFIGDVAGIAAAMADTGTPEAEETDRQGFGFALGASTERAAEPEPESYFTDDEE